MGLLSPSRESTNIFYLKQLQMEFTVPLYIWESTKLTRVSSLTQSHTRWSAAQPRVRSPEGPFQASTLPVDHFPARGPPEGGEG